MSDSVGGPAYLPLRLAAGTSASSGPAASMADADAAAAMHSQATAAAAAMQVLTDAGVFDLGLHGAGAGVVRSHQAYDLAGVLGACGIPGAFYGGALAAAANTGEDEEAEEEDDDDGKAKEEGEEEGNDDGERHGHLQGTSWEDVAALGLLGVDASWGPWAGPWAGWGGTWRAQVGGGLAPGAPGLCDSADGLAASTAWPSQSLYIAQQDEPWQQIGQLLDDTSPGSACSASSSSVVPSVAPGGPVAALASQKASFLRAVRTSESTLCTLGDDPRFA